MPLFLTPAARVFWNAAWAGVLAYRRSGSQLRVSAGLRPLRAATGFAIVPSHPGVRAPKLPIDSVVGTILESPLVDNK